jgi:hypothetical protein
LAVATLKIRVPAEVLAIVRISRWRWRWRVTRLQTSLLVILKEIIDLYADLSTDEPTTHVCVGW